VRVLVLVALVVAVACKHQSPLPRPPATDSGSSKSPAFHTSGVRFEEDNLDLCFDLDITGAQGRDAGLGDAGTVGEAEDHAGELALDALKASKLPSPSTCGEQFPDKPVFGTCTRKFSHNLGLVIRRYRFETVFGSDAAMKECITTDGGTWRAMPRDSDAFRRAEKEDAARQKARRP
jgi:hypothetical protein